MKTIISILISALMLISCGTPSSPTAPSGDKGETVNTYRQVTSERAMEMMQTEKDYIILDVRTAEEYSEGHIPNAINVPNESIGTEEIPSLPDKNQLIMVYCRSGRRSKEASQKLVGLGYTNIVEFGGIIDWTGETVK